MPKSAVLALLCTLVGGCALVPSAVDRLPELPPELARDLAVARTAPMLITQPASPTEKPAPLPTPPLPLAINKACTSVYEGYVEYPVTVCTPPHVQFDQLIATADVGAPAPTPSVPARRSYKLSVHPLSEIRRPWWCSVSTGPWYVRVEGKQLCNVNPNIRQFTAVLNAPAPVVIIWSGALTDAPPPLTLSNVNQTGESCLCCSGVMCPDQSCKPKFDMCLGGPPA
jgi:hypothetical protein